MGMFTVLPPTVKVLTPADAEEALLALADSEYIAFDTETTGLSRPRDRAIILALSDGVNRFSVWPSALPYFADLLSDPTRTLIAHNANYDCWMLRNVGIDIYRLTPRSVYRVYDTMVMHALVSDISAHDLKSITKSLLDIEMVPFSKVFNLKRGKKMNLEEVLLDPNNAEVVANYASLDAYATFKLFKQLRGFLSEMETPYGSLWDYYKNHEAKFTKILFMMELEGVLIAQNQLLEMAPLLEEEMLEVQKWFGRTSGKMYVNPSSNRQMGELFFGKLKKKPLSTTAGGAPQLNKSTLDIWASGGCEHAQKLLRYRELDKQLGTYVLNLMDKIHTDGRIHATFNQTGARTGRLSSSEPNLQNQPPFIREAYIPRPGYRLLAADYAQLEMRILAHMSKDETLCSSITDGLDVHTATAATMFKVSYDSIMAARAKDDEGEPLSAAEKTLTSYRKAAKAINFGLMYGQGAAKLASTINVDVDEARKLIRQYFKAFPKITTYFKSAIKQANEKGYCTTLMGRRRLVPGLRSIYKGDVADGERKVKNSPIQGTAAEIAREAMIKIYENDYVYNAGVRMLVQVHDEIVFEVPNEFVESEEFNNRIKDLMMHPFDFDLAVPLETSSKYGDNWLECK